MAETLLTRNPVDNTVIHSDITVITHGVVECTTAASVSGRSGTRPWDDDGNTPDADVPVICPFSVSAQKTGRPTGAYETATVNSPNRSWAA